MMERFRDPAPPILIGLGILIFWEIAIHLFDVPPYVLPGPFLILKTLWIDAGLLLGSLWITLKITLVALLAAALGGASARQSAIAPWRVRPRAAPRPPRSGRSARISARGSGR